MLRFLQWWQYKLNRTSSGFSNLVEQVSPAVVSVNVVKKMTQEEIMQQQVPEILRRFLVIKS